MTDDWHAQDWLLIAEALTQYAGPDVDDTRDERAWQLAQEIAAREGLALEQVPLQIDRGWPRGGVGVRRDGR